MEAWSPPGKGYVKLNIHIMLQNGNSISIGALLRNRKGAKLWGGMGSVRGMSEGQAILWAMHGILEAFKLKKHKVHIDLDNPDVYDVVRFQDEIVVSEDLVEALSQFNTLYNNHFREGITARRLSLISPEMNSAAVYMARYGMENFSSFVEAPGVFGDLQLILDRDMGLAAPPILMDNVHNFGLGEIVDAPPPPPPQAKKAKFDGVPSFAPNMSVLNGAPPSIPIMPAVGTSSAPTGKKKLVLKISLSFSVAHAQSSKEIAIPSASYKGKEKILEGYSFNNDGLLAPEVVKIIDKPSASYKGKEKFLEGCSFNNDGLLAPEVVKIIDKGLLKNNISHSAKASSSLDASNYGSLKRKVFLEDTTVQMLHELDLSESMAFPDLAVSLPVPQLVSEGFDEVVMRPILDLMEVDEVLREMARFDKEHPANP